MMLMRCLMPFHGPQEAFQAQEMAAAVIVMPRSRSCSIQSVTVVPSWTSPILWTAPGVEEDALGRRRLARVDVRGDADVARPLQRERALRGELAGESLALSVTISD